MPVMRYSEIALAAAFAVLTSAAWLLQLPSHSTSTSVARKLDPMIVVVIAGKRLSPEEKRLSVTTD